MSSVPGRGTTNCLLSGRSDRRIVGRRTLFATLVLLTIAVLLALAAYALSAGGFGVADALLLLFFGLTLPWSVIGFWNATIGFFIMRFARDPVATVLPVASRVCAATSRSPPRPRSDLRAQRAAGPGDPQPRADDAGDRRRRARPAHSMSIILSDTS